MSSKILSNAIELNKLNYDESNNRINFAVDVYSNNAPIADVTAGLYANGAFLQANAAFDSANNVAPQVQPAFDQANAAFEAANSGLVRQSFLANTGQTDFITNGYTIGYVDVFVNGLKLYDAEDFVATDGENVSIIQPELSSNDVVEIISHGNNPSVVARVDQFARDFVNNAWSAANSAYDFANSVYSLANNAANSAASSIPLTGSDNISGNLIPVTTNTYYLGSDTNRWHSLYVGPGSIDLGGLILSNVGGTLAVSTPGQEATPLAGEDSWVREQANAAFLQANSAFSSANNVDLTPAFEQANAAFDKANTGAQYNANTNTTGYFSLPVGTSAQRLPASNGALRYNSSIGALETYLPSFGWTSIIKDAFEIEVLVVGGGGGGGGGGNSSTRGGGGGAGGFIYYGSESNANAIATFFTVFPGNTYSVTVGSGGAGGYDLGGSGRGYTAQNGTSSTFGGLTAFGGGAGGDYNGQAGQNGGSGGGGGTGQNSGGSGVSAQGNSGGPSGGYVANTGSGGGGGGGIKSPGSSNSSGQGGIGGQGNNLSISGSPVGYSGGGGGGGGTASGTATHGGGAGGAGNENGSPGTVGTGGGGGGGSATSGFVLGGNGGSGIVIVKYNGPRRATGGTIVETQTHTYHTFTGSGNFTT